MKTKLLPASFFALTLGLAETGNAWRFAHALWALPPFAGELLQALAVLSFAVFLHMFAAKWRHQRPAALAELRDAAQIVPPLYLPYTASVLVNALAAGLFGYTGYGWMLFGVGAISWLVMDSAITHRLMTGGLPDKTRNFMGIYSAPPVVALVAYQVLAGDGASQAVAEALAGYALFVFAGLAFASRWLAEQDFAPGYWAYTFGLATLGQGLMLMVTRHPDPVLEIVAGLAFGATLLLVACVVIGSLRLLSRGGYFPPAPAGASTAAVGSAT